MLQIRSWDALNAKEKEFGQKSDRGHYSRVVPSLEGAPLTFLTRIAGSQSKSAIEKPRYLSL
jgi:hypothetical protein